MMEFITNNIWEIIVGILLFILVILSISYRKILKKKIKNESISFVAMVFSLSFALISFISKPQAIPSGTLALVKGGIISWAFPVTTFFIILSIITIIIFFRKRR